MSAENGNGGAVIIPADPEQMAQIIGQHQMQLGDHERDIGSLKKDIAAIRDGQGKTLVAALSAVLVALVNGLMLWFVLEALKKVRG